MHITMIKRVIDRVKIDKRMVYLQRIVKHRNTLNFPKERLLAGSNKTVSLFCNS